MKADLEVIINGETYPCRVTMGAFRRFKKLTGREATELDMNSLSDVADFVWCCTASACKADGIEFKYDAESFCDAMDVADMLRLAANMGSEPGDEQKKSL